MNAEAMNLRQTDGKSGYYEVWYMTWNHAATGQGFWLRFVSEAPHQGAPHAEVWFARFDPRDPARTFGFHRRFHIETLAATTSPFSVTIADARLGNDHTFGEVAGDGHEIKWELRWDPSQQPLRLFPDLAYAAKIGETTALWPNPRVMMSGKVTVDGEHLDFDRVPLGQTHLYGKKHVYSWAWAHCADFTGAPDALLELLAVRMHRRGMTLPPLVMAVLDLDGERHHLNQFRHVAMNRGSWADGRVAFTARSATVKLQGELWCTPDQLITAPYVDPDGTNVFCANTEIGDARITMFRRSGLSWREHRRLESRGRAHFELGGRERDPAVMREHVTVELE
jgi:hypothetical protein